MSLNLPLEEELDEKDDLKIVLKKGKLPTFRWNLPQIQSFLHQLSSMDSNNIENKASIGEREGRCFSNIVSKRHYYFTHGIGRSGDLNENQPKALGSSLLYKITNLLIKDFISLYGYIDVDTILVPLTQEMTLMMCLLSFKRLNDIKNVICWNLNLQELDLVKNLGLNPISNEDFGIVNYLCAIINLDGLNDQNVLNKIKNYLNKHKLLPIVILNVDSEQDLNFLKQENHPHLIIYKDKHSIFPINASIVFSFDSKSIKDFSKSYPGRATISSTIDSFISLVSQGRIELLKKISENNTKKTIKSKDNCLNLCKDDFDGLLSKFYLNKGFEGLQTRRNDCNNLFIHKKIPDIGWEKGKIEHFLWEMSSGSNDNGFISLRHFNFTNPINLLNNNSKEDQLFHLTNALVHDLFETMGIRERFQCTILPVATGMSLVLTYLSCKKLKPQAKYIIWSRIDQKSCFKSILTADLIPIIIDTIPNKTNPHQNDFITDLNTIEIKIKEIGVENIVCVASTTSCFAPRSCDDIEKISELCKKYNLFHVLNNAYGLGCESLMKRINRGKLKGNLDVFVQSTDKNLLVPVGGVIIASFNPILFNNLIEISKGKFSISSTLDVFITLMEMGKKGFLKLVEDRKNLYKYLKNKLITLASIQNEEVIDNSFNQISIAMTLKSLCIEDCTQLGSSLFLKNVFGAKVVKSDEVKDVCGYQFTGWGSHSSHCNFPYIASAAALGVTQQDVDTFISKLTKEIIKLKHKIKLKQEIKLKKEINTSSSETITK